MLVTAAYGLHAPHPRRDADGRYLALLPDGRFTLGPGSGERLDEHVAEGFPETPPAPRVATVRTRDAVRCGTRGRRIEWGLSVTYHGRTPVGPEAVGPNAVGPNAVGPTPVGPIRRAGPVRSSRRPRADRERFGHEAVRA